MKNSIASMAAVAAVALFFTGVFNPAGAYYRAAPVRVAPRVVVAPRVYAPRVYTPRVRAPVQHYVRPVQHYHRPVQHYTITHRVGPPRGVVRRTYKGGTQVVHPTQGRKHLRPTHFAAHVHHGGHGPHGGRYGRWRHFYGGWGYGILISPDLVDDLLANAIIDWDWPDGSTYFTANGNCYYLAPDGSVYAADPAACGG